MYQNSDATAGFYIAVSYTFLIHTVHFGGLSCDWLVYARGRDQTEVDWKVRPDMPGAWLRDVAYLKLKWTTPGKQQLDVVDLLVD